MIRPCGTEPLTAARSMPASLARRRARGEAKTRFSELVAAAVRGEEVVVSKAGEPQVRLVAVQERSQAEREAIVARRLAALGMWKDIIPPDFEVPASMTDEELEERWHRKGDGPAA